MQEIRDAMDAVLRGRWSNSSVAGSSLRGVSIGFGLLLFFLVSILMLQRQGFEAPFSLVMGPWWPAAALPGPFLLLLAFAAMLLLGGALSFRSMLPNYIDEVRLLLGVGPLREEELVQYNGLPWQVMSLNIDTILRLVRA